VTGPSGPGFGAAARVHRIVRFALGHFGETRGPWKTNGQAKTRRVIRGRMDPGDGVVERDFDDLYLYTPHVCFLLFFVCCCLFVCFVNKALLFLFFISVLKLRLLFFVKLFHVAVLFVQFSSLCRCVCLLC